MTEWTAERPTVPGFYWHRQANRPDVVVSVYATVFETLWVHELGIAETSELSQWRGEWKGPLEP